MPDDWEDTFPGIPWGAVLGRFVLPSAPLTGKHQLHSFQIQSFIVWPSPRGSKITS